MWIVGFVWNAKRNNSSQWTLLCGTRTGKQTAHFSCKVMKINLSLDGKSQINVSNVFKGLKPRWETPAYPHWREATLMSAMWEKFQTHKVFLPVPTGQKPYQRFHSPVETVHWRLSIHIALGQIVVVSRVQDSKRLSCAQRKNISLYN